MTWMGKKIRRLRKAKGISGVQLGEMTGVTDRTILRLETENRDFSLSLVRKVAESLKVPLSYLVATEDSGEECLESFLKDILKKCYTEEFAENLKDYGPYILDEEYALLARVLAEQLDFFIPKAKMRMTKENLGADDEEEIEISL